MPGRRWARKPPHFDEEGRHVHVHLSPSINHRVPAPPLGRHRGRGRRARGDRRGASRRGRSRGSGGPATVRPDPPHGAPRPGARRRAGRVGRLPQLAIPRRRVRRNGVPRVPRRRRDRGRHDVDELHGCRGHGEFRLLGGPRARRRRGRAVTRPRPECEPVLRHPAAAAAGRDRAAARDLLAHRHRQGVRARRDAAPPRRSRAAREPRRRSARPVQRDRRPLPGEVQRPGVEAEGEVRDWGHPGLAGLLQDDRRPVRRARRGLHAIRR